MLIDSHCHLNMLDLSQDQGSMDALVARMHEAGVDYMLCIGTDLPRAQEVVDIAHAYPKVFASVGIHPSEHEGEQVDINQVRAIAMQEKVVAIGETGLDYHYNQGDLQWMHRRFEEHIALGIELNKPLIIHSRAAKKDTIDLLRACDAERCGGVMHCFTEDWEMAKQALDLGFYISISGIVTFKKAGNVAEVAKKIPDDRLLIETDSPYLAPVPHRGKQCEPRYVRLVAQKVAQLRECSEAHIVDITANNFNALFRCL